MAAMTKSKIWNITLAVVIAFALWLYVISVVSPESDETFYDIPVSYQNDILEERGLMIVSETPTVTLHLKGNRSDLNELNAGNITILVDLAAIQAPGTQMLRYTYSFPGNLPNNAFEVLSQTPNLLQLKVENRIKRPIPIVLDYMDTAVPENCIADKENPVMDVAVVEVSGPESVVELIDRAVIQVDLTDQTDSIVGAFSYVLCDKDGEPVDAQMVTTNVEKVNLSIKIQRIKEVPIVLNLVDGGGATQDTTTVALSQTSVWVSGSENKLRELEFVELGTVNLAELKEETNEMVFDVVLPEGVTDLNGQTQVTATITFPELAKKKLSIPKSQFQASGVPAEAEVVWITETVEVEVRGPKDQIRTITEKDVAVTVDFADETLGGVIKVPKISFGSAFADVGAISVSSITANLQTEVTDATTG